MPSAGGPTSVISTSADAWVVLARLRAAHAAVGAFASGLENALQGALLSGRRPALWRRIYETRRLRHRQLAELFMTYPADSPAFPVASETRNFISLHFVLFHQGDARPAFCLEQAMMAGDWLPLMAPACLSDVYHRFAGALLLGVILGVGEFQPGWVLLRG